MVSLVNVRLRTFAYQRLDQGLLYRPTNVWTEQKATKVGDISLHTPVTETGKPPDYHYYHQCHSQPGERSTDLRQMHRQLTAQLEPLDSESYGSKISPSRSAVTCSVIGPFSHRL